MRKDPFGFDEAREAFEHLDNLKRLGLFGNSKLSNLERLGVSDHRKDPLEMFGHPRTDEIQTQLRLLERGQMDTSFFGLLREDERTRRARHIAIEIFNHSKRDKLSVIGNPPMGALERAQFEIKQRFESLHKPIRIIRRYDK